MGAIFKHSCRRRIQAFSRAGEAAVASEPFGGGSGGGPGDGDHTKYYEGWCKTVSTQIGLWAEGGEATGNGLSPLIYLLSGLPGSADGQINAHATQGLRLTVGQLPMAPSSQNKDINGVEIQTGDTQKILITRGMDEDPAQGQMTFDLPGIEINANAGSVNVKSLTMIKLGVAGGMSSITLTPAGIVMQGPIIQIN